MQSLEGIGVCPGWAIGPAARMPDPLPEPPRTQALDPMVEAARIGPAMSAVARHLDTLAASSDGDLAQVLGAIAMMANDPAVLDDATALARDHGLTADRAVWEAFGNFRELLANGGGYLAERVADLDDVRNRVVARLRGVPAPRVPNPGHPFVLVARDLAPADAAGLDRDGVLGFVTETGGPTSHTAILARSLGTPAVVGCNGASGIAEGQTVVLDGTSGRVILDPDDGTRIQATRRAAARRTRRPLASDAGRTADGTEVLLLANVSDPKAAAEAAAAGARGIGLLRTEFLFLDQARPPGIGEQSRQYAAVFAAFPGRKVIVRTLDAGADKPLPFLDNPVEPNPALGVRGIRVGEGHPHVLAAQLEAIALAAGQSDAEVYVMAPMVATPQESAAFVAMAREAGLERAGVMVEVPAAVLMANEIFPGVDFVSIGTNDLSQYTYAADRLLAPLAALNDHWQPALARLIDLACGAAQRCGTPVGVCGESASDAAYAAVLVGLGVRSLSMPARSLAAVNELLTRVTLDQCQAAARAAHTASSAAAAKGHVRAVLPQLDQLGL